MELRFLADKYYTCKSTQKRSEDLIFEIGQRYKCVSVKNRNKFAPQYINDGSIVEFIAHDGTVCKFFGIVALQHFTDSNDIIKDIITNNENKIHLIDEEIDNLFSKLNELKVKKGNIKAINNRLNLNLKLNK